MKQVSVFLLTVAASILANAMPSPGTVNLQGSCTIEKASGSVTIPLHFTFGSHLHVLGYVGDDGGDYEINIANNGGNRFENELGSVVIGFARAEAVVRNPPLLCPSSPEQARLECEERNRINNPPFVPAPADHFTRVKNETGDVKYEVIGGHVDPGHFRVTKIAIPAGQIQGFEVPVQIQTPKARLGGVDTSCSLTASRN